MSPLVDGSLGRPLRRAGVLAMTFCLAVTVHAAAARACPAAPGQHICTLRRDAVAKTGVWLVFPTSQVPAAARLQSAVLTIRPGVKLAVPHVRSIKAGSDVAFRVGPNRTGQTVIVASRTVNATASLDCARKRPRIREGGRRRVYRRAAVAGSTRGARLTVTYAIPPDHALSPARSPSPSTSPAPSGLTCMATLTPRSGTPFCGVDGPDLSALNQPLPGSPLLDPNGGVMTTALNADQHNADFGEYGTTVFDAGAAARAARIVCTQTDWGSCPLGGLSVAVNPAWKPSPGSDHAMVVVDYTRGEVYDLWDVSTDADGSIAVAADGSIHVGWGGVTSLDGSGQSVGATGSGLSHLYGMVRIFEAQKAVDDGGCSAESGCALADAIPHALQFATDITCAAYRSPALKSDGGSRAAYCVPDGARVFLDHDANCAFDPHRPIEEAVCFALKRYGAFATDTAGSRFAVGFEGSSVGEPGGSGPSPYAAGGLGWDYYDMSSIPWSHLYVVAP